jgi:hypothetical protein
MCWCSDLAAQGVIGFFGLHTACRSYVMPWWLASIESLRVSVVIQREFMQFLPQNGNIKDLTSVNTI